MGTLSPDGGGSREELPRMRRRGYFCPRKRYLPGRNCTPEGTLSPNGGGFREESYPGGQSVPIWRQFRGRNAIWARRECLPGAKETLFSTKTPLSGEGEGRLLHLSGKPGGTPDRSSREVFPGGVGLFLFAQFICLGYGRDDVREDVFFAKFLCKSHFIEVCKDIVVYTAEDYLYVLFL